MEDIILGVTVFAAVAIEATEAALAVVGFGSSRGWAPSLMGALAAVLLVLAISLLGWRYLERLPEHALKIAVACTLIAFGAYWLIEVATA